MKIATGINHLYSSQRTQSRGVDRSDLASLSTAASNGTASDPATGVQRANFSSMTRQEMHDWMNSQIRSGEMSLDDSGPFMAMTMKIPVGGGYGSELAASGNERIDFMQKVRDGIDGALLRHDATTLKMLESAMSIMQRHQGQMTGVNTHA